MPKLNPFQATKKKTAEKKPTTKLFNQTPNVKVTQPENQTNEPETIFPAIKKKGEEEKTTEKEEKKTEPKEGYLKDSYYNSSGIPKLVVETIRKRYIYPFSIDSKCSYLLCLVVRLKELGKNMDLVNTTALQLPLDCIPSNAEKIMEELQRPMTVSILQSFH